MPVKSPSADSAKLTLATVTPLGHAEPGLGIGERDLAASVQVGQSRDHGTHEGPLLGGLLVVGHGLHNGDSAPSAGEQHGPMGLGRVLDHTTRIDLEVR
jgi:hypothetical protein